jgi:hypothetical protein
VEVLVDERRGPLLTQHSREELRNLAVRHLLTDDVEPQRQVGSVRHVARVVVTRFEVADQVKPRVREVSDVDPAPRPRLAVVVDVDRQIRFMVLVMTNGTLYVLQ